MTDLEDDGLVRCDWANGSRMMREYHDREWGVPLEGEQAMFERLSLEAFQAGLSWATILRKRPAFREAFRDFDVEYCAGLTDADVDELLQNEGIIRSRPKIEATRANAAATIELRSDGGLEALVNSFAPVRQPRPRTRADLVASSAESAALAKELRRRGFRFVGPTNMYALMEATGLVNSHLVGCFRRGAD
jgi:DNA-3-methyladenine glycosylase I